MIYLRGNMANKGSTSPLLSIIIVNYNGENFLTNCINSIEQKCVDFTYEIVIVDNCSSDKSVQLIESNFPEVTLIKNKTNVGFAAGNNIGVKNSTGNYILLLNNDTVLLDDLKPAIDLIRNEDSIGIVGIKMLDGENRFTASFGKFPRFYNFFRLKTLEVDITKIEQVANTYIRVDWISGAFLLTTKQIWEQVNGLDESFFMYVEDVDFNKKVEGLGKISVFLSSVRFIHYIGFNKKREKLLISSYKTYIRNHKRGLDLALSLFMLSVNLFIKKALKRV